jgi:hypothetical protein
MSTPFKRLLLFLAVLFLLIGAAGWWLGRSGVNHAELPAERGPAKVPPATRVSRPQLPAPVIRQRPPRAPIETVPPKMEGLLARLMKNPQAWLNPTAGQVSAYLAQNRRNAESLLSAFRLTGDLAFLREAAQQFPDNAAVQTELALRTTDETERRLAIDSMRHADPANALGDYLSALDHLRHGRSEQAYDDLIAAAGKTQFGDYSVSAMQSAEEAYLAAGYSPVEAKAAAVMGHARSQLQPMRDLAQHLDDLRQGYLAAGDPTSAESIRQMGHSLGRQMQGMPVAIIDELSGLGIEQKFRDPAAPQEQQQEFTQRYDSIRRESGENNRLMLSMDDQEAIGYFDRMKFQGESAAYQWLRERRGMP